MTNGDDGAVFRFKLDIPDSDEANNDAARAWLVAFANQLAGDDRNIDVDVTGTFYESDDGKGNGGEPKAVLNFMVCPGRHPLGGVR
jgi:hypothetical protein